ncbi:MAG: hypothetical protein KC646_10615 [Candidatus Cloacimonetes bacterium]|nr:hypothetical protein [Candidatus Cloacimonadota bacterium]
MQIKILLLLGSIFVGSSYASGTIVIPPPPKPKVVLDQAKIDQGKSLFFKTNEAGVSCSTCHIKGAKKAFRRRKLARKLKKISKNVKKCGLTEGRMGEHFYNQLNKEDIVAIQQFLAKKYRLEDYLR